MRSHWLTCNCGAQQATDEHDSRLVSFECVKCGRRSKDIPHAELDGDEGAWIA